MSNLACSASKLVCTFAFKDSCSALTPFTAALISSQYATIPPSATNNKPIPVAAIPVLIPLNAALAEVPNALNDVTPSRIPRTPSASAIAPCTFNNASSNSTDCEPVKAIAPCTPANVEVTPCNAPPSFESNVVAAASTTISVCICTLRYCPTDANKSLYSCDALCPAKANS